MSENREKNALISKARHNLKNPVNAILGFSEMLIEDCEDEDFTDLITDLRKLHNAGNEILNAIDDNFAEKNLGAEDGITQNLRSVYENAKNEVSSIIFARY